MLKVVVLSHKTFSERTMVIRVHHKIVIPHPPLMLCKKIANTKKQTQLRL